MEEQYSKAYEILKKYNQEHLLLYYNEMTKQEKENLIKEILKIDFEQLNNLFNNVKKETNNEQEIITPIEYIDKSKLNEEELNKYNTLGEKAIKNGELAIITMAGGQGTRLGHNGPKGTYMLGITPNKSLFEILCDKLKKAKEKYNVIIPWYIMTSKENNDETVKFFENNNYFNYPKEKITFFIQGEMPMLDINGKVLLDEKGKIKQAADGHGGIFEAMFKNNVVEDINNENIKWIFIGPIDNPLANIIDETLIGISIDKNVLAAGKSLVKANPTEKVGVFCQKNGKPSVIEYTEITDELANATNEDGELLYGESHMNCNMFNIKAIEMIGNKKLPYHSAFKKATYINERGELVEATEPNSYKFESFIFDAFNKLNNMAILRVKREDEFAPVKNKEGVDSVITARELYNNFMNKH